MSSVVGFTPTAKTNSAINAIASNPSPSVGIHARPCVTQRMDIIHHRVRCVHDFPRTLWPLSAGKGQYRAPLTL
jgi:hypothetical protein